MRAEVIDLATSFAVQRQQRPDGSTGPPLRLLISLRPCWKKPPVELELTYLYEAADVVYYGVVGQKRND